MNFKSKKKQQDLTAKFYFPGSSKKSGVELRLLTEEMMEEYRKKSTVTEVDFAIDPRTKKLTKVVTTTPDEDMFNELIIDNMLVSWWGIFLDDKPLDCTKENKLMIFRKKGVEEGDSEMAFARFINESAVTLRESADKSFGSTSEIKN